ncbi:MAG: hypothetical protein ABIA67_05320 [Candidatus Margulisiibacteriota bacterium]
MKITKSPKELRTPPTKLEIGAKAVSQKLWQMAAKIVKDACQEMAGCSISGGGGTGARLLVLTKEPTIDAEAGCLKLMTDHRLIGRDYGWDVDGRRQDRNVAKFVANFLNEEIDSNFGLECKVSRKNSQLVEIRFKE